MHTADAVVLVFYLAGVVTFGLLVGRSQRTIQDYFVSGHRLPAWAILGSIVATETSTVTFISIPGVAFGGNYTFLQLALGYLAGRVVVAVLFMPGYFRGDVLTVYQLLGDRFGLATRRLASLVFLGTRSLADGFRLFATALVLAALLDGAGVADRHGPTLLVTSILAIGALTLLYTYTGGMTAVVWTDVVQLVVYLVGAGAAVIVLLDLIPGGWPAVVAVAAPLDKFRVFDFTWDVSRSYTFWSGVAGGMFLTTATHGTDQMLVQRYLCARSLSAARAALLSSGVVVFAQFTLFLVIGTLLFAFYTGPATADLAVLTIDGRVATDRVFPHFIVNYLPTGLGGLVLAAILAAAMSTLSSSLNSSSAAVMGDFVLPRRAARLSDAQQLRWSRRLTVVFAAAQMTAATAAIWLSRRVVDEVLGLAAFTGGLVLGLFLLGRFTSRVGERGALAGLSIGLTVMLGVRFGTAVSWQWYVLIGAAVTVTGAIVASYWLDRGTRRGNDHG
ncbi:MAG TPA: sodium/solute symporter [Vicinamibacterales bacterium]|nr:sodium/solute symporter [Vicinamibacterales bacterium]